MEIPMALIDSDDPETELIRREYCRANCVDCDERFDCSGETWTYCRTRIRRDR